MELGDVLLAARRMRGLVELLEQADVYPTMSGELALTATGDEASLSACLAGYRQRAGTLHRAAVVLAAFDDPGSEEAFSALEPDAWLDRQPLIRELRRLVATSTPATPPRVPDAAHTPRRPG